MRKIDTLGSVANRFIDYDANTNPQGAVISAKFMNDVQDELIGIQDDAGVAEAPGTDHQILKLIKFNAIKYSKNIGEYFWLEENKSPSAFNISTPDNFFPAINLSKINITQDITTAKYPLLVSYLRALKLRYLDGTDSEVNSWTATISGSNVTMPTSTSSDAILASLGEDTLVHGGYTNWRSITVAGVEYPITNINTATRVITVTGTPASGSQTVEFYQYRITGSSTSARLFEIKGRSFIAPNDSSGRHQNGLRVRDRFQGHWHGSRSGINNIGGSLYPFAGDNTGGASSVVSVRDAISDGVNGTPRTGSTTHGQGISAHLYMWARSYIA